MITLTNKKNKMGRTIKFRGKRVDNSEWVYGGYGILGEDTDLEKSIIIVSTLNTNSHVDRFYFTDIEVSKETIGQFTGLKDKNEVEIYEGDFVSTIDGLRVVRYFNGSFRMELPMGGIDSNQTSWFFKVCVVGNIFDNPEMLEL